MMSTLTAAADMPAEDRLRRLVQALLILGAWSLVGALGLGRGYLSSLSAGTPPPTALTVAETVESVWLWAALTPPMLALARRFPIGRRNWPRRLGLHLLFALAFHVADVALDGVLLPLLGLPVHKPLLARLAAESFINIFSYLATIGCGHALAYYALYHERRLRAAALEGALAHARLRSLEAQLRPHFLFNALHTVGALIRDGQPGAALEVVAELGEILRAMLGGDGHEVPLRSELELAERYLRIQQVRFGDRLEVRSVVEPAALDALVPRLLLQPLAENAIRHGIEAHDGPAWIEIGARVEGGALRVTVRNTGAPGHGAAGIGLGNTRERLKQLYGPAGRLELQPAAGGHGTEVLATVPLQRRRSAAAS